MRTDFGALEAEGFDRIEADPGGTQEAFARIGYRLSEALADLLDNSLDAVADVVLVRFFRDTRAIRQVAIVDNGVGMSAATLKRAMQFGARIEHRETDRGKYGIGLKAASFSQAQTVIVATRREGKAAARRWTVKDIRRGWYCARLTEAAALRVLDHDWMGLGHGADGTVVLWDDLDRFTTLEAGVDVTVQRLISGLTLDLGLIFHRFLNSGQLRLLIDSENVQTASVGPPISVRGVDPFGYPRSGRRGYPKMLSMPMRAMGQLKLSMHVWPPNMRTAEYRLGRGKVAARQGFYFYRNDRLIQAGGWNGVRDNDAEPHLSLARVVVEIAPMHDVFFKLRVQKSGVEVPAAFRDRLRDGPLSGRFAKYLAAADTAYRDGRNEGAGRPRIVLSGGVPAGVRLASSRGLIGRGEIRRIGMTWKDLPQDRVFEVDRDNDRVILNRRHRDRIVLGGSNLSRDGAAVKALIFFVVRDQFAGRRRSRSEAVMNDRLNELLLSAIGE